MERSKDYKEEQGSICITEGIFFLLWTLTDSGTGGSNRQRSNELGPMQAALGVEEVWGTTWGCSSAADAGGDERNLGRRRMTVAAGSRLHGRWSSGGVEALVRHKTERGG
jgi:hypothetical protein